jgi:AcrR family transcriptional regulator
MLYDVKRTMASLLETPTRARAPLTREQILRAALAYADEFGLGALSMHKLASRLGVKAMSLYNHVDGKSGLLDGLVELLWCDMAAGAGSADWRQRLRHLAHEVRETMARHPSAAHLLLVRPVLPVGALRIFKTHLEALQQAGFSRPRAVEVVRTVVAYALGSALSEMCWSCASSTTESELARLRRVNQMLPEDVPDDLLSVAMDLCGDCDLRAQFELGLDLMLQGIQVS